MNIDPKYIIWGSVAAVCGAAAFTYLLYPKDKKQLYEDVDEHLEDESDTECDDEELQSVVKDKDILVIGLEDAGKSAILASICGNKQQEFQPTDGFNVVSFLDPHGARLNLVELGGAKKNHQYWRHFYTRKNMVVMVIDASNRNSIQESRYLLQELLKEEYLKGLPFIIVANKQDVSEALDGDALMEELKLSSMDPSSRKRNIFHVQTQTPSYGTHKGISELRNIISTCK